VTAMVPVASRPSLRAPGKTASGFLIAQLTVAGSALVINVLSARAMGPDGRGQIALFLQVSYVLAVVALAGVDRSYPATASGVGFHQAVRDTRRLVAPGLWLTTAGCAMAAAAFYATPGIAWLIAVVAVVTAGNAVLSSVRAAAAVAASAKYLPVVAVGQVALLLSSAILVVAHVGSPVVWLAAYAVSLGIPGAAMWVRVGRSRHNVDLGASRRLGLKVLPGTLANIVALRADRILLPALAGYEQLGLYVVVATVTELIAWPVQAYVDAHIPAWRKAHLADSIARWRIIAGVTGYASVAAAGGAVAVWVLLVPVFGAEYRTAAGLAFPLAAAAGLYAISRAGVGLAVAAGRARAAVLVEIAAMVASIVGYLLFIPEMGAAGAAWGSLAGYGLAAATSTILVVVRPGRV
jgi:O-antigen/teichoic acid export membrane protein